MKKKSIKLMVMLFIIGLLSLFCSCSTECSFVEVSGHIYYGTGSYAQVDRIEFTVKGGSGHYKLYYAKTATSDEDVAREFRSSCGSCDADEEMVLRVDGYVSTGWYYWIWAVDDYGSSGYARWHP